MVCEVYRRRRKVNAGKGKMMVLNGEEGLECEVHVDGICLEHVSEFKYLGCVLDKSGTDGAECSRKRRTDLELGLYRWTTLEICYVLRVWIWS